MKKTKIRLDDLVIQKGFADSKSLAQSLIISGKIFFKEQKLSKPGYFISEDSDISYRGPSHPWVSRGGIKLDHGLRIFKLKIKDKIALDIGASTGGFSHVLLNNGAKRIYSIDVGYGQLHEKLLSNKNVISLERTNARYLTPEDIPDNIDILVCDVSFISLKKVLPEPIKLLSSRADLICLIKPQFEVGKKNISKGGIVRDLQIREDCCKDLKAWFETILGFKVLNIIESPIKGPKGNIEYLIHVKK
ncbi:MAG: TlyA family rRNA (cytidine-2'-O)-methyltransferase [Pelagibacterales bacterium]|nr:TlyA family rRNA (cytidine-2'-O)-methyltransferase [Pelagibacterales bacterium]